MSEEAPQMPVPETVEAPLAPNPDMLVEDPEKARAMAEAGQTERKIAGEYRQAAKSGHLIERDTSDDWDAAANRSEEQAAAVYDAKQSIDHELQPLTEEQEVEAIHHSVNYEVSSEGLEAARAEYKIQRALEDKINAAYDAVIALDELQRAHVRRNNSDAVSDAAQNYLRDIADSKTQVGERIKTAADAILRTEEQVVTSKEDAAQHLQEHEGGYYDSALKEMTDKGVPFEANNPNLNQPEQTAAAPEAQAA